jgi:cytidylate kinase
MKSPSEQNQYTPRIMITGETAGTGASTTSKLLAESLKLPIISGGKYFRALANLFNVFQGKNNGLSLDEQYQSFLRIYQQVFGQEGLGGVTTLMEAGIAEGARGDVLATFSAAIDNSFKKNGRIDTVWDYIVDQKTISDALQQPGFVWESKLAVISLELDQLQSVVSQSSFLTFPYLRVLLSLDPEVAAQRVGQRESRQVDVEEVLLRRQRDFDRYGNLYQIRGQRVAQRDLSRFADVVINTESTNPKEVATKVLNAYLQKISFVGQSELVLALSVINEINKALQDLQNQ